MGKQLGFYLTSEEENQLLNEIRNVSERVVDAMGENIENLMNIEITQFYILPKGGNFRYFNEKRGSFSQGESDIIQFCRTKYYTERGAEPGRIWTELRYWDGNENLITKDKALDDLYKQIVKMIKKRTTKLKDSPYYISQSAQEYIQVNDLTIN